jgi:hypothetical protein
MLSSNQIPVVWHEGVLSLEKRSRYGMSTLINETFDNTREFEFIHCSTMADVPEGATEAIIVVHGEHEHNRVDQIEQDLNRFSRSIIVLACDEPGIFPGRRLIHPSRKIWLQTPRPNSTLGDRFMTCGYPHDAKHHLAHYNASSVDRELGWFFSGQITHGRRMQCVQQLRGMQGGLLNETMGFWQGLERSDYYRTMANAKIIPCPSGPATPDTMRLAEALEAGCVPIADARCSYPNYPLGYWDTLLGQKPPFPVIDDWSTLPQVMAEELAKWPANRDALIPWWIEYKRSMCDWMRQDVTALRR